jgi:predicted DNA-binding transcriptional regulator AlpA
MLNRPLAAAYCGLSSAEFERQVCAGELPSAVKLGNKTLWERGAIDESLDRLTGRGAPNWRKDSLLYGSENAAAR